MQTTTPRPIAAVAERLTTDVRNGRAYYPDVPVTRTNEIPRARLSDLDQSHPGVKQAIAAVYQWRDRYVNAQVTRDELPGRAPSLILSGPNGVGKSHIARAVLWAIVSHACNDDGSVERVLPAGRWFASYDLIMKLAPAQTDYGTVEHVSVSSLVGPAPLVVIDDLGGEGVIPFVKAEMQEFERQARWFRFIDYCYANDVPCIITTNLDIADRGLAGWVGPRVWDRLNEMAPVGQMVGMWDVPSYRVKTGGR